MIDPLLAWLLALLPWLLLCFIWSVRKFRRDAPAEQVRERAILVDGSNVMHWGGAPSWSVLRNVINDLQAEGFVPYICFDANVGYKLGNRYMDSRDLAPVLNVQARQIYVVDKGVVADSVLLDLASDNGLPIVSNDRFRDWTVQYPWIKDRRRFRRGRWKEGNLVWDT